MGETIENEHKDPEAGSAESKHRDTVNRYMYPTLERFKQSQEKQVDWNVLRGYVCDDIALF